MRKVKAHEWPIYQYTDQSGYTAFHGPKDMYQVINQGVNSGCEGVSVNHFITHRMVRKHLTGPHADMTVEAFREKVERLFANLTIKITT